jgi:hypothetical protein
LNHAALRQLVESIKNLGFDREESRDQKIWTALKIPLSMHYEYFFDAEADDAKHPQTVVFDHPDGG